MLSQDERMEIRQEVYRDVAEIEDDVMHRAGTYTHLCLVWGEPTFAHSAVGPILRYIPHPPGG